MQACRVGSYSAALCGPVCWFPNAMHTTAILAEPPTTLGPYAVHTTCAASAHCTTPSQRMQCPHNPCNQLCNQPTMRLLTAPGQAFARLPHVQGKRGLFEPRLEPPCATPPATVHRRAWVTRFPASKNAATGRQPPVHLYVTENNTPPRMPSAQSNRARTQPSAAIFRGLILLRTWRGLAGCIEPLNRHTS